MGLPTVGGVKQSGRWVFRSQASRPELPLRERRRPTRRHGRSSTPTITRKTRATIAKCRASTGTATPAPSSRRPHLRALRHRDDRRRHFGNRIGERRRLNLSQPPPRRSGALITLFAPRALLRRALWRARSAHGIPPRTTRPGWPSAAPRCRSPVSATNPATMRPSTVSDTHRRSPRS